MSVQQKNQKEAIICRAGRRGIDDENESPRPRTNASKQIPPSFIASAAGSVSPAATAGCAINRELGDEEKEQCTRVRSGEEGKSLG